MILLLRYRCDGKDRTLKLPASFFSTMRKSAHDGHSPAGIAAASLSGSTVSASSENDDLTLTVTRSGARTSVHVLPRHPLELIHASIHYARSFKKTDHFFVNGYQSWTDTREFTYREELHNMNFLPRNLKNHYHFPAYGDAWFRTYRRGDMHGFTYAYIREHDSDNAELVGSYNEERAWLIITYHKRSDRITLESDCGGRVIDSAFPLFDFVRYRGNVRTILQQYFEAFGTCSAEAIRGYTSWYNYYQDIDEEKMRRSLALLDNSEVDLFQIDDGYETFVGDWLDIDQKKFPADLSGIVEETHRKGMLAGIWLAPFVCETKSRLFREHPDWIYMENGRPVFAGCNWSGDVVLDIRKPEVLDYIRTCLRHYREMGFDLFKLDFLYAASLIRDEAQTRAERMRLAMQTLRDILPDALLLGCGVPLSSAFNLVDYCRIGADVSLAFDDTFFMRGMHRERISTRHTLQNTIFRQCMDGTVFRCDPDVFLLRDDNIHLSPEQRRALTMLNHLCGSVFMTSDDTAAYDPQKKAVLEEARRLAAADVTGIRRDGRFVHLLYSLEGNNRELIYDTEKGVLQNG